jgi:serine/threonine protein kinase
MATNPYQVLQVGTRATEPVIVAAFRALAKEYQGDGRRISEIQEARDVLLDPVRRKAVDAPPPKKGKQIGQYRILDEIAEGGFGITYKAEHIVVGAPVCLKHAFEASAVDTSIMLEEARAVWDLRHWSLPAMRDLFQMPDGSMVLVMSYVPGPTLEQCIESNGPLDPEDVCWIASRILNVLQYLHYNGVVHGDIKPQNIIIQEDKHSVVLVDFGLSLTRPTASSSAKGYTQFYASPEHQAGTPLVPESDFYSLGVTLTRALGGDIESLKVPGDTPDNMLGFIKGMIRRDITQRPNFRKTDVCAALRDVRLKDFGREFSSMKPLGRKPAGRR